MSLAFTLIAHANVSSISVTRKWICIWFPVDCVVLSSLIKQIGSKHRIYGSAATHHGFISVLDQVAASFQSSHADRPAIGACITVGSIIFVFLFFVSKLFSDYVKLALLWEECALCYI